jgi:AcrR family transcriptional regulator
MSSERTYAGLGADQRRADRRTRLVDAGLVLFGSRGYAKTTIEQVCSEAGVATRHFYEHFGGREALLRSVYEQIIGEVTEAVLTARDSAGDGLEARFQAGIAAFCHGLTGDERKARVVLLEIVGVSPELETLRHGVIAAFAALVRDEAARFTDRGELPPRRWDLTAVAVVGAVHEMLIDWLLRERRPPVERIVDEGVRLAVAALRA